MESGESLEVERQSTADVGEILAMAWSRAFPVTAGVAVVDGTSTCQAQMSSTSGAILRLGAGRTVTTAVAGTVDSTSAVASKTFRTRVDHGRRSEESVLKRESWTAESDNWRWVGRIDDRWQPA